MTTETSGGIDSSTDEEKYVIGAAIIDRGCAAELIAKTRPQFFRDPLHVQIMAEADRQYGVDQVFDALRIGKALRGKVADDVDPVLYLAELAHDAKDSPSSIACFGSRIATIIQAAQKHKLYGIFDAGCEAALNGKAPDEIFRMVAADLDDFRRERDATKPRDKFSFADLRKLYPKLNPPVVDGLFRAGETVNIVSTSKVGKSWLGYSLALSVITGQKWLGRFDTAAGKVLLVDNELHRCTLSHRIPAVAEALAIEPKEYEHDLDVWTLRGNLRSLADLATDFDDVEPGTYQLILLDAKYRFAIEGQSENDNASEARLYNLLDQIADRTKAAIVLVHHTSKGVQADKRVTDVGSGAGSQSRAADCHVIMREHEEPGVCVLDAALRSFAPIDPLPLRWAFPLWIPADDIDPGKLRGKQTATEQRQHERDKAGMDATLEALAEPATMSVLRKRTGFRKERQENLLNLLLSQQKVSYLIVKRRGNDCHEYRLSK